MRKVFWDNPYQTTLETTVSSVSDALVTFDQTIAYSFAGAQESDKATINGMPILDSRIEGPIIIYTLREDHGLTPGQKVLMEIDWTRRHRIMRLHFTAELVLELITQKWGLVKIGAHISETKARIDFKYDRHISTLFEEILTDYNEIIRKNLPIHKDFSDKETQRRFWKIEGFAQVPCGGTHVNTTGEVGMVTLKRVLVGKGVERIEIRLVDAAVSEGAT